MLQCSSLARYRHGIPLWDSVGPALILLLLAWLRLRYEIRKLCLAYLEIGTLLSHSYGTTFSTFPLKTTGLLQGTCWHFVSSASVKAQSAHPGSGVLDSICDGRRTTARHVLFEVSSIVYALQHIFHSCAAVAPTISSLGYRYMRTPSATRSLRCTMILEYHTLVCCRRMFDVITVRGLCIQQAPY